MMENSTQVVQPVRNVKNTDNIQGVINLRHSAYSDEIAM